MSVPLIITSPLSGRRSEEHTSELQHGYISYAVFCLKKKKVKVKGLEKKRRLGTRGHTRHLPHAPARNVRQRIVPGVQPFDHRRALKRRHRQVRYTGTS